MFYYLQFTEVPPGFLAAPFLSGSFLKSGRGIILGWFVFVVFSIAASGLYAALFYKLKGPWIGIVYGAAWWGIWYMAVGPASGMMAWPNRLGADTLASGLCIFLLWGLFIGYTAAFEFNDERHREPVN